MAKVAVIKTKPTSVSVEDFINNIENERQRNDSKLVLEIMEKIVQVKPTMWGNSMIGFGDVRYKSPATGREVDWFKIGFSPRKANLSLHLMDLKPHAPLLAKLGKHKTGAGCVYINKLDDINMKIFEEIIAVAAK